MKWGLKKKYQKRYMKINLSWKYSHTVLRHQRDAVLITFKFHTLRKRDRTLKNSAICLKQKSKVVREGKMRNQTAGMSINIHVKDRILTKLFFIENVS